MHALFLRAVVTTVLSGLILGACGGGSPTAASSTPAAAPSLATTPSPVASVASTPPASPAPSAVASAPGAPTAFTSPIYGYMLTVPAGWKVIVATSAWDGKGAPFHDVPQADQFVGPSAASAWVFAAPTTKDLAARVKESIAANAAAHGNTCPPVPEVKDAISIGSEPGTLLGYNCGILINSGIAVHHGTAYLFGFRDTSVHSASDPTDRAVFLKLLESVRYPD